MKRALPWIAGALALLGAAAGLAPQAKVRGFDLDAFSRVPVLEGGRVKPIDSVARNSLLVIRGQQSFSHLNRSVSADEWLLDVMFRPDVADEQPVFRVDDPEILGILGVAPSSNRYFPWKTLIAHIDDIERQAQAARQVESGQRTRFQAAIVNLFDRIFLYHRLQNTLERGGAADPEREARLADLAHFRSIPPQPAESKDAWHSVGEGVKLRRAGVADPALEAWKRIGDAYDASEPSDFRQAVSDLRATVAARQPEALSQAGSEVLFNRAQPFYVGMIIYVLALLALFTSWLWKRDFLQPAAFGLLCAGSIVHTLGLIARVALQGRPPVTNLYSSAVFVGWTAVVLGIFLERMYRKGFGTAVAAASGFASLIVAHHLMGDGDTMEMMRAVLDSNFWLATHVVTITIGYGGTFLAGALAIAYTIRRHFVKDLDKATSKTLTSMTYGVVCFSLFFSFIGTVLGGIWADQSWGRFWGWDPKENGALLIVLWNAAILHARWGGYVREKGIMSMAIIGNAITSLSWFGVNMLGVGLHSYGFMEGAFFALSGFVLSQFILAGLCLLPPKFWKPAVPEESAAT